MLFLYRKWNDADRKAALTTATVSDLLCEEAGLRSKVLQTSQLNHLVNGGVQPVCVLATGGCKVRLTASASLNQLGSLANHLSCIEGVVGHHVVAEHYAERGFAVFNRSDGTKQ